MKKYSTYLVILILGVLLGYVFFGRNTVAPQETGHEHGNTTTKVMWTCSMHPQIMQLEAGQCPICGMDLIPATMAEESLSPHQFSMTANAMALANIQTTIVGGASAAIETTTLSGKITENEKANAIQTAHFGGRIEKLYINATGESVRKGQMLALIYSPDLLAAQQELLTAVGMKKSQPKLYVAVRNKLKLWKLSEQQIDQIESSGKTVTNFPVYANVSGVVSEKMVEPGDHIKEGQPLYKISNLNTVWAVFDVYENQIATIRKEQQLKITSKAYPNMEIAGTISFIDPVLNTASRTVSARVVLNNDKAILKPGMFVQGDLLGNSLADSKAYPKEKLLLVPKSSVLWTGKRSIVYVKSDPDTPIFEWRQVTLGDSHGEDYAILNGLKDGEEVVTNGAFTVDAAAQLQGKKSMMNSKTAHAD